VLIYIDNPIDRRSSSAIRQVLGDPLPVSRAPRGPHDPRPRGDGCAPTQGLPSATCATPLTARELLLPPHMSDPQFKFRIVVAHGVRYLRFDDVATFIRELGSGEETDVRNRLNEAARRITLAGSKA